MSKATQGEARTAAEEERKRATMVGNDSVNMFNEGGGTMADGGGKKYEIEGTTGVTVLY